ncbi:hypothetical protein [Paracidovorax anthurii]|uniref:Uncharacterized protein n=1 Tax=Paracidovorax anthurii TaxID=78229 RepID=A0A328ZUY9_9BURK|nr:hypothetical protein [Paracidovorax anthurii]RAR86086.1 hypothetical protein AX018_100247 [Paracidovorax anthurii]
MHIPQRRVRSFYRRFDALACTDLEFLRPTNPFLDGQSQFLVQDFCNHALGEANERYLGVLNFYVLKLLQSVFGTTALPRVRNC